MKRTALIMGLLVALIAAGSAPVTATKPNPEHKVIVCHATADFIKGERKYVRVNVDIASSGYVQGGHHDLDDPDTLGAKHARGGDIIPPYQYGDFAYPGQNWTSEGQAIWSNGCVVPPPPPPVVPPEPPKRVVFAPRASSVVCGDPRVKAWLDNRRSNVAAQYRIRFVRAKDGQVRVDYRTVAPKAMKVWGWRWVKGGGTYFSVKVRKAGTDNGWRTLIGKRIYQGAPWGTGRCIK